MSYFGEASASSMPTPLPKHLPKQAVATRRYTKNEWEAQKSFIESKYPLKGMTLGKIENHLRSEKGFLATQRQLKRKITDWGLEKRVKHDEMKFIFKKQAHFQARGKNTTFRVRGLPVDQAKVERWQKRKDYPLSGESPLPATPSDVSYDALTERGSSSPFPQSMDIDFEGQNAKMTATQHFMSPPPGNFSTQLWQIEEGGSQEMDFGQPSPNHDSSAETESVYSGESPAPFTAPPLPALTVRDVPLFDETPAQSMRPATVRHPTSASDPPVPSILQPQHRANEKSSVTTPFPRSRYRQREEEEHRQRLELLRRQHGANHPATLDTLSRLGGILIEQGRYKYAEEVYKQVAEGFRGTLGEEDPRTIEALIHLANVYHLQSSAQKALALSRRTYDVARKHLSPSGTLFLSAKAGLAVSLSRMGKHAESEGILKEVIAAEGLVRGPDHDFAPNHLNSLAHLALCLDNQSKYAEAEQIWRQLILARSIAHGVEDLAYLRDLHHLGLSLFHQRKYEESEVNHQQVLEAFTRTLGPEHPDTLKCQLMSVKLHIASNRLAEGEQVGRDVIEKLYRVLGRHHDVALSARLDLAEILLRQHNLPEAEAVAKDVTNASEKRPDLDWHLVIGMTRLGRVYFGQGRVEDGRSMLGTAVGKARAISGEDRHITQYAIEEYESLVGDVTLLER